MAVYAIVIMVILAIIMTVFIVLSILKEDSNNKKNQHNIIYPFNAKLQSRDADHPDGEKTVNLLTSTGAPQLQCPAGTHIEVIGAWSDVVDPNGICSNKPSATFKMSCGFSDDLSAGVGCQDITDCAPGMTCSGSQQCVPLACNLNSDCGSTYCGNPNTSDPDASQHIGQLCDNYDGNDTKYPFVKNDGLVCIGGFIHKDPSGGQCLYCDTSRGDGGMDSNENLNGYCAQSPSCANLTSDAQNFTCTTLGCAPRDASAYLADLCDGEPTCKIIWDPSSSKYFGPKSCNIEVDWKGPPEGEGSAGGNVSPYQTLPVAAGWGGGTPGSGQYESSYQPSTYSLGFYVHGIYNCIPDST